MLDILTEYTEAGITNAIKDLKARKDEWKTMGESAERVYVRSYSWEIMNSGLVKCIEDCKKTMFTMRGTDCYE